MPSDLSVARLGHVNLFADDYDGVLALLRAMLGAEVLREWEAPEHGSRNALAQMGASQLEVFAATAPDQAAGRWLTANGPGWHSLGWTVPSLDNAVRTLGERGVRVTECAGAACVVTHPEDLHGLCLHISTHTAQEQAGTRDPAYRPGENPLGITGGPTIKVASPDPEQAAADVASLAGRPTYDAERNHLNAVGHGVCFDDHAIEFVGSASGGDHDLVGGFLAEHGRRIFSTTYLVREFSAARAALAAGDVPFTQWGRHSLLLRSQLTHGARIELTDES